jgi:transcriptional regulator with XRE-family HTH domain
MRTNFGERVRSIREDKGLLLRQVAAFLGTDTALMSKIERGERNASRAQVIKIAEFLNTDAEDLLTLWIADKIEMAMVEEPGVAYQALKIANKNLKK